MSNAAFSQWMKSFTTHLFSRHPVDATFAGLREYNAKLPDMSPEGLENTLTEIRGLLTGLREIDYGSLTRFEKIDFDLARGYLEQQAWERESGFLTAINPTTYTGEAAFALVSLFISDFRRTPEKSGDLAARLKALPGFFKDARNNLQGAPVSWTERAIDECTGLLNFLKDGVPILVNDEGLIVDEQDRITAEKSVVDFKTFLEDDLMHAPVETVACGGDIYRKIMHWSHYSDADPLAYADHAEEMIARCNEQVAAMARDLGADSPEELLAEIPLQHPSQERYLDTYTELWQQSRELNDREELLSWADFPIDYKPIPEWARTVQPHLYFLFYRCPPRYNRPERYTYHVIPIESNLSPEKQETLLRNNNTYVIKTNHVLHHGGIGHHIQNWNAVRSRSVIGQIAANDGPARLTMLCAGTLCEGWACYISNLAGSRGFLTPLETLAELNSMRRMAARAVVDVRLHYGIYSLEEAAAYYQENAGMSRQFAESEAVKNSLFPGGAVMYLYGVEGITSLREEMKEKKGAAFSLKDFHDTFLSYGSIPVDRIAAEMRAHY